MSNCVAAAALTGLRSQAKRTLETLTNRVLYEGAVDYLYLSETRSRYAIEHESGPMATTLHQTLHFCLHFHINQTIKV
jgi:hypothetical protein